MGHVQPAGGRTTDRNWRSAIRDASAWIGFKSQFGHKLHNSQSEAAGRINLNGVEILSVPDGRAELHGDPPVKNNDNSMLSEWRLRRRSGAKDELHELQGELDDTLLTDSRFSTVSGRLAFCWCWQLTCCP